MSDWWKRTRLPPRPPRDRGSAHVALIVVFTALMLGIWAGLAGRSWGRYLAFGSFAALFVIATVGERVGWRRAGRNRDRSGILSFRLRRKKGPPEEPPPVTPTSHRERIETRAPDRLERAGAWLLWLIVVVVILGGVFWFLGFIAGKEPNGL